MILILHKKIMIFFFILLTFSVAFSQSNQGNIIYFGNGNGLDFNYDPPKALTDGVFAGGSISTICDEKTGKLLFYTDGINVINSTHKIMKNGNDLLGHASNVIIPYPQKKGLYYIFSISINDSVTSSYEVFDPKKLVKTNQNEWLKLRAKSDTVNQSNAKLYYHLIDMNKNNGLGEVIKKNQFLYKCIFSSLTAARHANGKDFWLITHQFRNDNFRVYLINEKGLQENFITTTIGEKLFYDGMSSLYERRRKIKISANFQYLCLAQYVLTNNIQIFKFDNNTGNFLKFIRLVDKDMYNLRGLEFSPDASKLYLNFIEHNSNKFFTKQYNLELPESDIVKKSKSHIFYNDHTRNAEKFSFWGDMQVARDGKIYALKGVNNGWVSTIENPNEDWNKLKFNFEAYTYTQGSMLDLGNITHLLPPFFSPIKIDELFSRQILFDTKQSKIESWHEPILVDIFQFLEENKDTKITIIGHTDNEGNSKENQKLSFQRAKSIADYFVNKKIDKNRIKVEGLGDTKPIIDNENEENKSKNRRVEFLITE
ncbi:MAG: OmpA family protein [Bacteroidetes bacterium]|nr:MAG: OmpA family protein [Bacteroidota bacterium]